MTFVAEYESASWFTEDAVPVQVTCTDGDVLIASAVVGNQLRDLGISGGGLTWTLRTSVSALSRCTLSQWTAVVGPGQGGTFTVTATISADGAGGLHIGRYSNIVSIGGTAQGDATGPAGPSLNIDTTMENSAIVVAVGDHSTVDGAARAWRTDAGALTERAYWRQNFENAAYVGEHPITGPPATVPVGLTAPAMRYSIGAVELVSAVDEPDPDPEPTLGGNMRPDGTLVANAWLRLISGLPASCLGPTLPPARRDPAPAWITNGFIQHTVVGGSPNIYVPIRHSVIQLDCWAVTLDDRMPPWGLASRLAEDVWAGSYRDEFQNQILAVPPGYVPPRLLTVHPLTESRKINEDAAGYAHFQFDVQFNWTLSTMETT
jgi:hypothetical protein